MVLQALVALLLTLVVGTTAHAIIDYANPVHVAGCESCHSVVGSANFKPHLYTDLCMGCHSPGGTASLKPFTRESIANPYGNDPVGSTSGTWRSHNSFSPYQNDSKVGAQAPVEPTNMNNMSPKYYQNPDGSRALSCGICHSVHEIQGGNPDPDPALALRDANNNDELCFNCHRERRVASPVTGSHPVEMNYATNGSKYTGQAYTDYSTSYYKVPRNRTASNPSSNLGSFLKNGKVVCSTCHSVHLGDGDSATMDNWSTANGTGSHKFSESDGTLLRSNLRGSSVSDVNLCTNCHKDSFGSKTRQHGSKGQQVQCSDCHGAHVYNGTGTVNTSIIAQQLNFSSARGSAKGKTIVFTDSTPYYKNNGQGICEVCHHVPTTAENAKYPSVHEQAVATSVDCAGCHEHSGNPGNDTTPATAFSFNSNACSSCHGYPPPQVAQQLTGYPLDENNTAHLTHAGNVRKDNPNYYGYSCLECHYSGMNSNFHQKGTPQDLFKEPGPIGTTGPSTPSYNAGAFTCSTVYCHSNGGPNGSLPIYKVTPAWSNGKNTIVGTPGECGSCHDAPGTLATGAHAKHTAGGATNKSFACQTCHSATVNGTNAIIKNPNVHVDGKKDLKFFNPANTATQGATVNCSNICHYDAGTGTRAAAVWTTPSTGACGTCHPTSPAISASSALISSRSHSIHLTGNGGPQLGDTLGACQQCHVYTDAYSATHVDGTGTVDKKIDACTACHPGTVVIAEWGNAGSVTCRACHTGTASVVTNPLGTFTAPLIDNYSTLGHGRTFASQQGKIDCNSCHDQAAPHIGIHAMVNYTGVMNRITQPINDICFSCHRDTAYSFNNVTTTKRVTSTHRTAENQVSPDMTCTTCHDPHGVKNINGVANIGNVRASITFHPDSSAVNIVMTNYSSFVQFAPPYRGFCQVCHTKANYFRRGVPPFAQSGENHLDGSHNRCTMCHTHSSENYAFEPQGGGCNGCHGYPPAKTSVIASLGVTGNYSTAKIEGVSLGGGAHTVQGHIPRTATAGAQNGNCSNCHFGNQHMNGTVQVTVNPTFKFKSGTDIVYAAGESKCSNVSCHFQKSPNWKQ